MASANLIRVLIAALLSMPMAAVAQDTDRQVAIAQARQKRAAEEARRHRGLRAAAAIAGRYEGHQGFLSTVAVHESAEALMSASDGTVIGRVVDTATYLSRDERDLYTVLTIEVHEVLSGDVSSDAIRVALPGGKIVFDDGRTATTFTAGMTMLAEGDTGLFFLHAVDACELVTGARGQLWMPTNGLEGYFGVDPAGVVKRLSPVASPVTAELEGKPVSDIVSRQRASSYAKKAEP